MVLPASSRSSPFSESVSARAVSIISSKASAPSFGPGRTMNMLTPGSSCSRMFVRSNVPGSTRLATLKTMLSSSVPSTR